MRIFSFAWLFLVPALAKVYDFEVDNGYDATLDFSEIQPNAKTTGMWGHLQDWPLVAIHMAVVPDGTILTFGTPSKPHREGQSRKLLFWDYTKGFGKYDKPIDDHNGVESFCAGVTLMPDGKYIIAGGSSNPEKYESFEAFTLDWKTRKTARAMNLKDQRWYGTLTNLPNGKALMTGGGAFISGRAFTDQKLQKEVSPTPEIFDGNSWKYLGDATNQKAFGWICNAWWFPRAFVAPHGKVVGISANVVWELNWQGGGSTRIVNGNFKPCPSKNNKVNVGPTSTACMYDKGKILQVGGNGYNAQNKDQLPGSKQATVFDINEVDKNNNVNVKITEVAEMNFERQWADATVLANGHVLVSGGSKFGNQNGANAVYETEIWNPQKNEWTVGPKAANYRGYHSTAVLMPNGAVFIGGGGLPGPVTQQNVQIFYPPYLFKNNGLAPRPKIISMSAKELGYGSWLQMEIEHELAVTTASLMSLPIITHSFDSNQRRIPLKLEETDNGVQVQIPNSPNLAQPGWHYIFVLDLNGVPSKAVIINVGYNFPQKAKENSTEATTQSTEAPKTKAPEAATKSTEAPTTKSTEAPKTKAPEAATKATEGPTTKAAQGCLPCPNNASPRLEISCVKNVRFDCVCGQYRRFHSKKNICIFKKKYQDKKYNL